MPRPWIHALLLSAFVAGGCHPREQHRDPEPEFGRLHTIAFGGDTVLARRMNSFAEAVGPRRPLEGVRDILSGADISVVNLECILAAGGEPTDKGESNPYYYRGRPELVRVLTEAGVDVASLANNHAADYGPEAVAEGVEILRKAGVQPLGAGRNEAEAMAPVFQKVGDTVVGFVGLDMTQRKVGATSTRAGQHFVWEKNPSAVVERVREQVDLARRYAHLVFLVTHWGGNYDEEPSDAHRALARRLVREAGIDGLLGTSAHQFQGLEIVDGRPIVNDAGDLLFDFNSNEWTHKTAIFVLHFDRVGVRWVEAIPVRMGWATAKVATGDDQREILARLDDLSKRLGTKLWITGGRARLGIWDVRPRPEPRETYEPPAKRPPQIPSLENHRPSRTILTALPETATKVDVAFENGIKLVGFEYPDRIRPHKALRLTTYWTTSRPQKTSYWIFAHVDPAEGVKGRPWRGDHQPGDWGFPTTIWRPGEVVKDSYYIRAPSKEGQGAHDIFVGLFATREGRLPGARVKVIDPTKHDGRDRVRLGRLTVAR